MKGNLIRVYRKRNKMTQKELAAKSGVSEYLIRNYENNKSNPKYGTLKKIATVLGIPVSEILGYKLQGRCDNLQVLSLGERIQAIRTNKNISQSDLAKKLNIPRSTYANYENNHREPNYKTLLLIAKALGVPVSELLNEECEENKRNPKYETLEKIADVLGIPVSEILGYKLQGQCDNLRALSLGERIRRLRLEKNLKQSDLAKKANISRVTLGNYERGDRTPNTDSAKQIAEALEVPVSELLNEECEENNELLRLIIDKKNLDVEVDIKEDYLFKLDEEEIEEINNKAKEIFRILLKGLL